MEIRNYKKLAALTFVLAFLCAGVANAQIQAAGGGYYRAGYPTVYGSFGQASAAQSRMYDQVKVQTRRMTERDALIKKWGLAAVEKAEREAAAKGSAPSNPQDSRFASTRRAKLRSISSRPDRRYRQGAR